MVIDLTKYCGATRHWNTHLLALEIAQNKNRSIEFDLAHEHYDVDVNGIHSVIQDCFNNLNVGQPIIYVRDQKRTIAKIYRYMLKWEYSPCTEIGYGQFFSRPTYERLYCHYKHLTWQHRDLGIATFHFCPDSIDVLDGCDFANFLWEEPEKWAMLKSTGLPYADIKSNDHDQVDELSGVSEFGADPKNYDSLQRAYKKMCAEVVCETNTEGKTYFITEKTLRPMLNGCIPLIISNAGYEGYLKSLGFDMFDDVLDKSYDKDTSAVRIEKVYHVLEDILVNKDELWLKELSSRLQNNIERVTSYIRENIV